MARRSRRWILPLGAHTAAILGPSTLRVGRDMGARGGRAHLWHPNLNLALTHFPLDVSNKSKRLMVPSASCHAPPPTLGRRTATEQTLRPSGYLPGQRDPCFGPYPAHQQLMRSRLRLAVSRPGADGSHVRRLGTQSPATCDCKLSSRLRGGSPVAQATSTPQPQIEFTIF